MRAPLLVARVIERGYQRKDAGHRNERVHRDAQFRLPSGGHALHALFELLGRREQAPAFLQQRAAGGREPRPMAAAIEEQHIEVVLQPSHRVGDGGRDPIELHRGRGEAAAAIDGIEHRQRIERNPHIQII